VTVAATVIRDQPLSKTLAYPQLDKFFLTGAIQNHWEGLNLTNTDHQRAITNGNSLL